MFFAVQVLNATLPGQYSVTLKWDPSSSTRITGYRLYYGTDSGNHTHSVVVGKGVTTATVPGLAAGVTYFFAVTALGATGLESDFSNEVSDTRSIPGVQLHAVPDGQFILTVTGPMGHTYDIEATEDFTTWKVIGRVTLDASGSTLDESGSTLDADGSVDFTDTNAANFSQRFYRTHDIQPRLFPVRSSASRRNQTHPKSKPYQTRDVMHVQAVH